MGPMRRTERLLAMMARISRRGDLRYKPFQPWMLQLFLVKAHQAAVDVDQRSPWPVWRESQISHYVLSFHETCNYFSTEVVTIDGSIAPHGDAYQSHEYEHEHA